MLTSRRCLPLFGAAMLLSPACFGEYAPALEASQSTEVPTTTTSTTTEVLPATSTALASSSSSSASSGEPALCDHLDIVIVTDVSISMAPFASGIVEVLFALGPRIEQTLAEVGTYRFALAYNAPPIVNQGAYSVPGDGGGCTQLGALVRGQDACVEAFDERPFLTEEDDLGGGITCLAQGLLSGQVSATYERPQILDTLLALLGADDDPALEACNEGFHQSPDPMVVILIADADDESDGTVFNAVAEAIGTQEGPSLKDVGLFVIGTDASGCPDPAVDEGNDCGAEPACRVQEFIDIGFVNPALERNVRRFNICRTLDKDTADVAEALLVQLTAVIAQVCSQR